MHTKSVVCRGTVFLWYHPSRARKQQEQECPPSFTRPFQRTSRHDGNAAPTRRNQNDDLHDHRCWRRHRRRHDEAPHAGRTFGLACPCERRRHYRATAKAKSLGQRCFVMSPKSRTPAPSSSTRPERCWGFAAEAEVASYWAASREEDKSGQRAPDWVNPLQYRAAGKATAG